MYARVCNTLSCLMAKRFCCRNNLKKTKEHCHSNLPRHQKNSDRHQIVTSYTSNMPHPDNTTQHDTSHYSSDQYDSNDDEDYSNVDSEINEGVWRFMKTPRQANLAFHLNAVDKFLFDNFKEEIDVVTGRVFSKINTSSDIMNQIVNLFVDPLISGWLNAANASNLQDDVPLTDEDMRHFIKTLAYLSFYGKTPTVFFLQRAEVQRCLICRANTTCKCKTCTVPLCRFPFGRNRKSCWIKFHNDKKID